MQNQFVNMVLSTDAKPRLKWTAELHQRFVEAVLQLGGPDKATPKSLMSVMGIPGLTLYHLKSHLQKFRLGKSQLPETSSDHQVEDFDEVHGSDDHVNGHSNDGSHNENSMKISQALQLQLEVQRKLNEQIEVQRHLQLRIEAQGKYLQSVLRKAQEALSTYSSSSSSSSTSPSFSSSPSSSPAVEIAKEKLSQLVSLVKNGGPTSSLSELTEIEALRGTIHPIDSSLTSSESSPSVELSLAEINGEKKRSRCSTSEENGEDKVCSKRSATNMEVDNVIHMIDLNSHCESDDFEF